MPTSRRKRGRSSIGGGDESEPIAEASMSQAKRARKRTVGVEAMSRSKELASPAALHLHALSQEVLLRVLRQLQLQDLLNVSLVSHAWHRLSLDSSLWKRLYLSTFARPTLLGSSTYKRGSDRPWRELYKISTNWRRGQSTRTDRHALSTAVRQHVLPSPMHIDEIEDAQPQRYSRTEESALPASQPSSTLLQVWKSFYFTVDHPDHDGIPVVRIQRTDGQGRMDHIGTVKSQALQAWLDDRPSFGTVRAVELQLDEARHDQKDDRTLRVALFYSTGQWSLFDVTLPSLRDPCRSIQYTERHSSLSLAFTLSNTSFPRRPLTERLDPPILARLHSPLLVTCSSSFTLRMYRIRDQPRKVDSDGESAPLDVEEIGPTWRSTETWAPVVLSLERETQRRASASIDLDEWGMPLVYDLNQDERALEFKVILAYSTPVYPSAWSVGVQEFSVTVPASFLSRRTVKQRHAFAVPAGSRRPITSPVLVRHRQQQHQRPVTSIEYSFPYIITTRADNTLDVFSVDSGSSSSSRLQVHHVRTLFGHTSRVSAVALDARSGRVVSGSADGQVKVWDLGVDPNDERKRERPVVDIVEAEEAQQGDASRIEKDEEHKSVTRPKSIWEEMRELRRANKKKQQQRHGQRSNSSSKNSLVEHVGQDDIDESALIPVYREAGEVKRVWFDEDKIVSLVQDTDAGEEHVRVLRFD